MIACNRDIMSADIISAPERFPWRGVCIFGSYKWHT